MNVFLFIGLAFAVSVNAIAHSQDDGGDFEGCTPFDVSRRLDAEIDATKAIFELNCNIANPANTGIALCNESYETFRRVKVANLHCNAIPTTYCTYLQGSKAIYTQTVATMCAPNYPPSGPLTGAEWCTNAKLNLFFANQAVAGSTYCTKCPQDSKPAPGFYVNKPTVPQGGAVAWATNVMKPSTCTGKQKIVSPTGTVLSSGNLPLGALAGATNVALSTPVNSKVVYEISCPNCVAFSTFVTVTQQEPPPPCDATFTIPEEPIAASMSSLPLMITGIQTVAGVCSGKLNVGFGQGNSMTLLAPGASYVPLPVKRKQSGHLKVTCFPLGKPKCESTVDFSME